ncbi:DUF1345 domain-containing protein [Bradyrhizobium prioriisuperbiae]|uniref:DUF1345 domain-containing protein n=1 Tax=Bradyrhizobium prioriisuperbiae TaxID=2854389 RepID=UPI0028E485C8|nr:DUF1345 domain-containing protein [Bradyrhizobium prioritasuperba]
MAGDDNFDGHLQRFRSRPLPLRVVLARPRFFASILIGLIALAVMPVSLRLATRLLIAWDIAMAIYLLLAFTTVMTTGTTKMRHRAALQDDGRFVILILTAVAAFATLGAIVAELGPDHRGSFELLLATTTIVLSWAAIHTTFALHYAHEYYRGQKAGGLAFPGDEAEPDYWDFVYFSFVIGMTAQVSDVGITDKIIRRTATAHGVASFIFNTALLALMVNIAASAI